MGTYFNGLNFNKNGLNEGLLSPNYIKYWYVDNFNNSSWKYKVKCGIRGVSIVLSIWCNHKALVQDAKYCNRSNQILGLETLNSINNLSFYLNELFKKLYGNVKDWTFRKLVVNKSHDSVPTFHSNRKGETPV